MPISPVPKRSGSSDLIQQGERNNSSDYFNIEEPPAPSKTPDPSNLFPLKRRSSSNYQTALLGDQLKNVDFNRMNKSKQGSQKPSASGVSGNSNDQDPLSQTGKEEQKRYQPKTSPTETTNTSAINDNEEEDENDNIGGNIWEGSKRALQRRSTAESFGDNLEKTFNVQYQGSVGYPPQSTEEEVPPSLRKSQSGSNIPRSYHSNQQSPSVATSDESNNYFPRSFEYADFKRRMSRD